MSSSNIIAGFDLELPPVDVDGDGTKETAKFVARSGVEVTPRRRTGYLVSPDSGTTTSLAANFLDPGSDKYQSIAVGLGAGQHVWELSARNWEGSQYQWGDGSSTSGSINQADATGGTAVEQAAVFDKYIGATVTDSDTPAKLSVLGYGDTTLYDGPIDVALEEPSTTVSSDEPGIVDLSVVCVKIINGGLSLGRVQKNIR